MSKQFFAKPESQGILYPIKPEYVRKIISGEKKYEFRRVTPLRAVEWVIIYSTVPEKKIMAYASVRGVLSDNPEIIWKKTRKYSGIDKVFFDAYFKGAKGACAIELKDVYVFPKGIPMRVVDKKMSIPQSFRYVDVKFLEKVIGKSLNG